MMNVVSRKITKARDPKEFENRAKGILSHNNMYMASLFIPLLAMLPALFINFSLVLLVIFLIVAGLLAFCFFVIFTKIACIHCRAKRHCPNAKSMGLA